MKNKKLLILILFICLSIIFVACKKDDVDSFENKDGTIVVKFYIESTEYNSLNVAEGDYIESPNIDTYLNYTIKYWTKNGNLIAFPYRVTAKDIENGIEFKAVVTQSIDVTFISNGIEYLNKKMEVDSYIQEPETPKRDGYKFDYWSLDGEKISFPYKIQTNQNLTFIAEFASLCDVVFMLDNNTKYESQTLYSGNMISLPQKNPEVKGKTFIYWVDTNGNKVDEYTIIREDTTYYALFEDNNFYNVKYYVGDTLYYSSLAKTKAIEIDYEEAEIFYGWYQDKNLTKPYDFSSTLTSDISLYAKYILNDYSIYVKQLGTSKTVDVNITNFNFGFNNYKNTMTIGAKSKSLIATYTFVCNNGKSVYVSYDLLNGKISGKYGVNDGTGSYSTIDIDVEKYNYNQIAFDNYETIGNNGTYCTRLESLSLEIAKQAYDYIYDVYITYTQDYIEKDRVSIPNEELVYTTTNIDKSITINTDKKVYSIKIICDGNVVAYAKNSNVLIFNNIKEDKDYLVEIIYEYTYSSNLYRKIYIV